MGVFVVKKQVILALNSNLFLRKISTFFSTFFDHQKSVFTIDISHTNYRISHTYFGKKTPF